MKVYHLLGYGPVLLVVFYEPRGYQFRIMTPDGSLLGRTQIFYTEGAALRAGKAALKHVGSS